MRRVCVLGPGQPERGFRAGGEGSARRGVALIGNVLRGGGGLTQQVNMLKMQGAFFTLGGGWKGVNVLALDWNWRC